MKIQKSLSGSALWVFLFLASLITIPAAQTPVIDGYPSDWISVTPVMRDIPGDANMVTDCLDLDSAKTFLDAPNRILYVAVWQQTCTPTGIYFHFDTDKNVLTGTPVPASGLGSPDIPGTDISIWAGSHGTNMTDFTISDWNGIYLGTRNNWGAYLNGDEHFFEARFYLDSIGVDFQRGCYLYISNLNDVLPNSGQAIAISQAGVLMDYPFGIQVSGYIKNLQGDPITGARVWAMPEWSINSNENNNSPVISGPDGYYVLSGISDGMYRVYAKAKGYAGMFLGDVYDLTAAHVLNITYGVSNPNQDIHMVPGGSISGTALRASDMLPLTGIHQGQNIVVYRKSDTADSMGFGSSYWVNDFPIDSTTGNFIISDLAPGTYNLWAQPDGYYMDSNLTVRIVQGENKTGAQLILKKGASVSGLLTDMYGDPLNDQVYMYSLSLIEIDSNLTWNGMQYDLRTPDGSSLSNAYYVPSIPPGSYYLLFHSRDWGSGGDMAENAPAFYPQALSFSSAQVVTISEGDSLTNINVKLERKLTVSGNVKDETGTPVAGVYVNFSLPYNNKIFPLPSVMTDASGSYSAINIAPNANYIMSTDHPSKMGTQFYSSGGNVCDPAQATAMNFGNAPESVFDLDFLSNLDCGGSPCPGGHCDSNICYDSLGMPYPCGSCPNGNCNGSGNYYQFTLDVIKSSTGGANITISYDTAKYNVDTFAVHRMVLTPGGRGLDFKIIGTFPRSSFSGNSFQYVDNTVDNSKCYVYKAFGYGRHIISSDYRPYNDSLIFNSHPPYTINLEVVPYWAGLEISWMPSFGKNDSIQSHISKQILVIEKVGDKPDTAYLGQYDSHWTKDFDQKDFGATFKVSVIAYNSSMNVLAQSNQVTFTADSSQFPILQSLKNLTVGPGQQYQTIQSAIDAADNYDRIVIYPKDAANSPYPGRISTKGKAIVLSGSLSGGKFPVIDAQGDTGIFLPFIGSLVNEYAPVSVENLRIQNATVGIRNNNNARIFNTQLINCGIGVWTMPTPAEVKKAVREIPFYNMSFNSDLEFLTITGKGAALEGVAVISGPSDSISDPAWGGQPPQISFNGKVENCIITDNTYGVIQTGDGGLGVMNSVFFGVLMNLWSPSNGGTTFPFDTFNISYDDPKFRTDGSYLLDSSSPYFNAADQYMMPGASLTRNNNNGNEGPPVSGFVAVPGNNRVSLRWNALNMDSIGYNGKFYYWVLRLTGDSSIYVIRDGKYDLPKSYEGMPDSLLFARYLTVLDTTTDTFFVDNTAKNGTPYLYMVVPMDSNYQPGRGPDWSADKPFSYYTVTPFGGVKCVVRGSSASFLIDAGGVSSNMEAGDTMAFSFNDSTKWEFLTGSMVKKYYYPLDDGRYYAVFKVIRNGEVIQSEVKTFTIANLAKQVPAGRWNLLSIPSKTPMTLVKPQNLETSPLEIYYWDPAVVPVDITGSYIGLDRINSLEQAKAYWWRDEKTDTLKIAFSDRVTDADAPMIALSEKNTGWNQVSSPFLYPVDLTGLGISAWGIRFNPLDSTIGYDSATSVLNPWEGYWVNVTSPKVITLDTAIAELPDAVAPSAKVAAVSEAKWAVRLSAKCGRYADWYNTIGMNPSADNGPDAMDLVEPPSFDDALSLYFTHNDWKPLGSRFASDIRKSFAREDGSEIEMFPFVIENNGSAGNVELSVPDLTGLPSKYYFGIVDMGAVYDMRSADKITLPANKGAHTYYAVVTDNKGLLEAFSGKMKLSQNYPNPFNPATTISFTVPYEWRSDGTLLNRQSAVALGVYAIDGRLVKKILSGTRDPGQYQIQFNGLDKSERPLSSGVYLYRLMVGKNIQVRKMVILK